MTSTYCTCGVRVPASGGVAPQVMAGLAALDLLVPIENGFRPNLAKAQRVFRFVGEGGAAYHQARSICKAELTKDKAYILAAWPHGLLGGGGHFCFVDLHLQVRARARARVRVRVRVRASISCPS